MTMVKEVITEPGDSGGPWFLGTTAYGIHSGRARVWFRLRSVFTPVALLREGLGVQAMTR